MSIRVGTNLLYQGIGLKKFSELTDWYFKQVDTTFNNTFTYAKAVASAPPIFSIQKASTPVLFSKKQAPTAPLYKNIIKPALVPSTMVARPTAG